jgi:3-methyl-2-oxobutanoate hydroxymethyltransferase
MKAGFRAYDEEVKAGSYPAEEHTYPMKDEVYAELENYVDSLAK